MLNMQWVSILRGGRDRDEGKVFLWNFSSIDRVLNKIILLQLLIFNKFRLLKTSSLQPYLHDTYVRIQITKIISLKHKSKKKGNFSLQVTKLLCRVLLGEIPISFSHFQLIIIIAYMISNFLIFFFTTKLSILGIKLSWVEITHKFYIFCNFT